MSQTETYQVVAVEPSAPPRGVLSGDWCRYVVANKRSRIAGRRCGSPLQVRQHAERFASSLNERVSGRSMWAPRSRKRQAQAA